jgi:N4-gp56 family major capsid protein
MTTIISLISVFVLAISAGMFFGDTTAAAANTGGYTAIPQAVRDFYSREVLFQAQPRLRFLQFAKVKRDLQAVRGKSIVFVKYGNLTGGGSLEEQDVLTPEGMTTSEISVPVKEQANSVQVTEYLLRTSLLDVLGDASKLLANNMAKVLDGQFRDTVLQTTNVVYGGTATSLATMTAASAFTTKTVKDAVETLATHNAPRINGDYYVCIAHPHQLRQLRDDANWINANTYMGRRQLYLGEVGMYEGCIFIETTQMPHLDAADILKKYGSGATITSAYEAVFFGDNAYAWGVALDVELRDDGVVELGRKHTLGWYGIWGTGIIEEGNIVKALTA